MAAERKQFEITEIVAGEAGFRAYGSNLSELFSNAALALFSIMADLSGVEPKVEKTFRLSDPSVERLFTDFLSELVYLKDAESMLFSMFDIRVSETETYELQGKMRGEPINPSKHKLGRDVKGVTMHRYRFEKIQGGYSAQVVLDI